MSLSVPHTYTITEHRESFQYSCSVNEHVCGLFKYMNPLSLPLFLFWDRLSIMYTRADLQSTSSLPQSRVPGLYFHPEKEVSPVWYPWCFESHNPLLWSPSCISCISQHPLSFLTRCQHPTSSYDNEQHPQALPCNLWGHNFLLLRFSSSIIYTKV